MKLNLKIRIILLLPILITSVFLARPVAADSNNSSSASLTREELAEQIQFKAKQLDDINAQIESTKKI